MSNRFLYWSDVGSTVKIERASLSGNNRETIISTGLAFPTSIDIDYAANKLVWVDASRDTVETANLDGTVRRVIRRMSHAEFYDVAVFRVGGFNYLSIHQFFNLLSQSLSQVIIAHLYSNDIKCTLGQKRQVHLRIFLFVAIYNK